MFRDFSGGAAGAHSITMRPMFLIFPAAAISEGVEQPDQNADGDDDDNDGDQRHRLLMIGINVLLRPQLSLSPVCKPDQSRR